jgi:hypothetical protein
MWAGKSEPIRSVAHLRSQKVGGCNVAHFDILGHTQPMRRVSTRQYAPLFISIVYAEIMPSPTFVTYRKRLRINGTGLTLGFSQARE